MKNPSTVSGRGPATVPLEIGKRISRSAGNGVGVMAGSAFENYKGVLKPSRSRREINAWIREMRDEEKHQR